MEFMKSLFKIIFGIIVVSIPVLAVWLSSSLAVYLNAPLWGAILAAVILFPILPLIWELWRASAFEQRQKNREEAGKKTRDKWLTFSSRFIIRTFVLNLGFLALLLGLFPKDSFEAVNTRGDWVLANNEGGYYDLSRKAIFATATGLEGLHNLARKNPYEKYEPVDQVKVKPKPNPIPIPKAEEIAKQEVKIENNRAKPDVRDSGTAPTWPMKSELHPLVKSITNSDETSIKSVAKYLSAEKDPFLRVKAINDYVADRIAYDAVALSEGRYPPQDAETVFKTRMAVCAGYSKLVVALGKHTGDEIRYITGVSREQGGQIAGGGHAWNAAKIEGAWYLIDTTWNSGTVNGAKFTKSYKTDYLFTPPEAFGVGHFPKDPQWQLRENPIDRGAFVRQPMLRAGFFANALVLESPKRSQVTISSDSFEVRMKNPLGRKILGTIAPKGGGKGVRCDVDEGRAASVTCPVTNAGIYEVNIFATASGRSYPMVGKLIVVR